MINKFDGQYAFLSNFHPSPFTDKGLTFATVEHYYQANKITIPDIRAAIATARSPGIAKRMGQKVALRPDWEQVKRLVMYTGVLTKFKWEELAKQLLNTHDEELIEGNWWHDNYWGDCSCPKCANIPGQNHLGKILMAVRKELLTEWRKNRWRNCVAWRACPGCGHACFDMCSEEQRGVCKRNYQNKKDADSMTQGLANAIANGTLEVVDKTKGGV